MVKRTFVAKGIATSSLVVALIMMAGISLLPVKYVLTIEVVMPSRNDVFQVFYDIGSGFNEADSKLIRMPAAAMDVRDSSTSIVTIPLPAKKIKGLRIDPGSGPAAWNLKSITLESKLADYALRSHTWLPEDIVREFMPLHAIDTFRVRNEKLFLNASGDDPYFAYKGDFRSVQEPLRGMARHLKAVTWIVTVFLLLLLVFLDGRAFFDTMKKSLCFMKQFISPSWESRWISPVRFWIAVAILSGIELWLVSSQAFPARASPHDDQLFLDLARNLASGRWLGEYNNRTLLKQPFYPIWIATMFWLGIPLSLSQHLLYIGSCILCIVAIRPLLRNNLALILIIYVLMLFHPIGYPPAEASRVLREGIYPALTLLVLCCAIGLLLRRGATNKEITRWNIGLGVALAAFWLTREESIWIVPSLCLLMALPFFSYILSNKGSPKHLFWLLIPIVIPVFAVISVSSINAISYGVFATNEELQGDFTNAINALQRVKSKRYTKYLDIPREKRERIYAVSPAFAELRPFLEGDLGRAWSAYGAHSGKDISKSHFQFALRDAVALAGYYKTGQAAIKFYKRLALEVNSACDKGLLECERETGLPILKAAYLGDVFHREDIGAFCSIFLKTIYSGIVFSGLSVHHFDVQGAPEEVKFLFRDMTRDRISNDCSNLQEQTMLDNFKMEILNFLVYIYRFINILLVVLGIMVYLYKIFQILLRYKRHEIIYSFVIMSGLFVAVFVRAFIVTLMTVNVDPGFYVSGLYQLPMLPLITLFSLIGVATYK
jgi:hypothetical protein